MNILSTILCVIALLVAAVYFLSFVFISIKNPPKPSRYDILKIIWIIGFIAYILHDPQLAESTSLFEMIGMGTVLILGIYIIGEMEKNHKKKTKP